jgi:2-iminobutanoate/2-iminopropanoate deaminase
MTTITPVFTGVGAHIAPGCADAAAVSVGGTQVFVSGTPGLRGDGIRPEGFIDEARQCWVNVEAALDKSGAKLTDIVSVRQWLASRDHLPAYLALFPQIIRHQPAAVLSIIDGLVWPNLRLEVEVIAVVPA